MAFSYVCTIALAPTLRAANCVSPWSDGFVPPFRIASGSVPRFNAYGVFSMEELELEWDVPTRGRPEHE